MEQKRFYVEQNIAQLEQGIALLERLSDRTYALNDHQYFKSGVGRHVRHVIDHYDCFLHGLDGTVDYDARERDERVETDRSYAIDRMRSLIDRVSGYAAGPDAPVEVRSNGGTASGGARSSVARELQYLASHTVHHYALIGTILHVLGAKPPETFGVAPSTLAYERHHERTG